MKLVITLACVLFLGALMVTAVPAGYNQYINTDEMLAAQYNDIDTNQVATTQNLGTCLASCRGGTSAIQVCIIMNRHAVLIG